MKLVGLETPPRLLCLHTNGDPAHSAKFVAGITIRVITRGRQSIQGVQNDYKSLLTSLKGNLCWGGPGRERSPDQLGRRRMAPATGPIYQGATPLVGQDRRDHPPCGCCGRLADGTTRCVHTHKNSHRPTLSATAVLKSNNKNSVDASGGGTHIKTKENKVRRRTCQSTH